MCVRCADEDEDKELMVREAFHILTQGVEMTHYEVNVGFRKTYSVKPKVVWLNPDSLRLCVSTTRPPVVQTELYTGVYLRDVAEVVGGAHTFGFAAQPEPPSSNEQCLNLIASERTLCLQLPSEFSRNWFLERIRILCDDILTSNERSLRESIKWTNMNNRLPFKESHRSIAESTEDFLVKGITVLCHTPSGSINESTLFYSSEDRRLIISKTGGFFKFASRDRGINISDIYSLRPGTHSFGFVQTKSQNEKQENVRNVVTEDVNVYIEMY